MAISSGFGYKKKKNSRTMEEIVIGEIFFSSFLINERENIYGEVQGRPNGPVVDLMLMIESTYYIDFVEKINLVKVNPIEFAVPRL